VNAVVDTEDRKDERDGAVEEEKVAVDLVSACLQRSSSGLRGLRSMFCLAALLIPLCWPGTIRSVPCIVHGSS